jgi:hypothetical protein
MCGLKACISSFKSFLFAWSRLLSLRVSVSCCVQTSRQVTNAVQSRQAKPFTAHQCHLNVISQQHRWFQGCRLLFLSIVAHDAQHGAARRAMLARTANSTRRYDKCLLYARTVMHYSSRDFKQRLHDRVYCLSSSTASSLDHHQR